MTLSQYLQPLKRQWPLILVLTALVMAAMAAFTFTRVPQYAASTQLFVTVRSGADDVQQLNQGNTFAQQRVKTYAQMVTFNTVLKQVIDELRLPYTTSQLRERISVESPIDTLLIDVKVTDPNPSLAAATANAIADRFPAFINSLETLPGQSVSPVNVQTGQRADVPLKPVSPRVPLNLAIGLLLGLGVGVGAAYLRDQLNTTIKSVSDIETITGAVPLGVVPLDRNAAAQPLAEASDASGRAEAYRSLRTNLQFTNVDEPPRVVVVTSSLPGEGKSTTACNLALTLALNGASTVLVGADLRKPTLGNYLGISNAVGLTNVLAGQYRLPEVLVPFMRGKLAVLPSGPTPPNPSELLDSAQMRKILTVLSDKFEYVVIDAPPVLPVTDGALLAAMADGALVVTRHGKTTLDNLRRTLQALTIVNAKVLGTAINFAPVKRDSGYSSYGYGYTSQPTPGAANGTRHGHGAAPKVPQPSPVSQVEPAGPAGPAAAGPAPSGAAAPSGSSAAAVRPAPARDEAHALDAAILGRVDGGARASRPSNV